MFILGLIGNVRRISEDNSEDYITSLAASNYTRTLSVDYPDKLLNRLIAFSIFLPKSGI